MLRSFALKRFAPYLPLAGLLLVGLASFVLYVRERSVAAYPVLLELENATQLKEQQVKRWFKEQKAQILEDAKADLLQRSAAVLLTTRINLNIRLLIMHFLNIFLITKGVIEVRHY